MKKTALITGVTGQDGAYLAKYLLSLGYHVYGAVRRTSTLNLWRIDELGLKDDDRFTIVDLDLLDQGNIIRVLEYCQPDELYNLAAQSFVAVSFEQPIVTSQITGLAVTNLLEAVRVVNPKIHFYQASTSEMFGMVQEVPQNEATPFYPRSPYAVAKLYAHWMCINYHESYDIFASSGILFNHESPLRGGEFVTRKITDAVAKIKMGKLERLELGNMDAKRDWGYAAEYVEGMHAMLQHHTPDTFVLATGRTETVRSFVEQAFLAINVELAWEGNGQDEVGRDASTGKVVVGVNPVFYRPTEVELLIGDPAKAKEELGWEPKTTLEELCRMMVVSDIERNEYGFSF
jgi:GDPmannose 4,6-dehydratase